MSSLPLQAPAIEEPSATGTHEELIASLLHAVHERCGVNFSVYRKAMVRRRIASRMVVVGCSQLEQYVGYVRGTPHEALQLLDHLAIKVSRFYRNVPTFDLLRREVLPSLLSARGDMPLCIWSAGCGRGEEAYTLAMLLAEAGARGEVVATDISRAALVEAGRGIYPPASLAELPTDLLRRYLERWGDGYRVCSEVRSRVRFVCHDLTSGSLPTLPGPADLVACRNVLIYLQPKPRAQVLSLLHQALAPGGVLCLGEAEWPSVPVADALDTIDRRARLFRSSPIHRPQLWEEGRL